VIDFTSALYLGMQHPSRALSPWSRFTTGAPAALSESPRAGSLAGAVARLQGCEAAALSTSTLHLFWDWFGMGDAASLSVFVDAGLYAVGRWGVERAAALGAEVRTFPHHDACGLRSLLWRHARARRRTVVITDGFCPGCGRHAPVKDYLALARNFGGQLIMDDTQAIGIFGRGVGVGTPYGSGGGGTLRRFGLSGPDVLVVSSLAKGFGVPVATLAGSSAAVARFESRSETRTHCSPPSNATLSALAHALVVNESSGDALRLRLCFLVRRFKRGLREFGLTTVGGLFPVQTLARISAERAAELAGLLEERGVKAILRRDRCKNGARLSFVISAPHTPRIIDLAVRSLAQATGARSSLRAADAADAPCLF
jgi:8-amino-7-oxononanoate synthase